MKKYSKGKTVESAKANKKIYDFFSKKTSSIEKVDLKENTNNDCINLIDSSDEQENDAGVSHREIVGAVVVISANEGTSKKRKYDSSPVLNSSKEQPVGASGSSVCNFDDTRTPKKQNLINVKSPEQLLSSEALKIYQTPEKQAELFRDRIRTPTPKKLCFEELTNSDKSLLSRIDEISMIRGVKSKTPTKKLTPTKKSNLFSPNKLKKAKLCHTSPDKLSNAGLQVLDKFINITPTKSNTKLIHNDVVFVRSSEKKQSSILNYVSPSASKGAVEAQLFNESTPKKEPGQQVFKTPTSKAKTKLDFNSCQSTKSRNKSPANPVSEMMDHPEFIEFDDDWGDIVSPNQYSLDLSKSEHCKIIRIDPFASRSIITLESTKTREQARCILVGFWVHVKLSVDDIVRVIAKKLDTDWIIDNENGLLIFEPDLLVSTTSVVGSLWCKRKAILQERFRGFEPTSKVMLVGTMIHSILQDVLKNNFCERQDIQRVIMEMLQDSKIIRSLYECDVTAKSVEAELMQFAPKIERFVKMYVTNSDNTEKNKNDWKGRIDSIEDIEDNIWSPELGLKGKIDVSITSNSQTMPLELKTGRATVSLEHRGQVMMYIMMMNKLGYSVNSGLLLYLREGVLREIPITEKEKRDIIILRNELTYYLTRQPKVKETENGKKLLPAELPEPINHPACEKCPYKIICTSYAQYNNEDISSYKTLINIQKEALPHLSEVHLNYFMKWVSLIAFESSTTKGTKELREIYTLDPKQREINGKCIKDLSVVSVVEENSGTFEHKFEKAGASVNFYANGICESNYVVVSTYNRPAVACGFVTNITSNTIAVNLDRNLNVKHSKELFHLDTYESSSVQSYNMANLALLLELSERSAQLRRIIIDKELPTFKAKLPQLICTKGKLILRRLNVVQQRAVLKAIAANEYFLIKGMPGTGKTTTIVALIQLLYTLGKSIIITSHTHSAVDNVCIKLIKFGVELMRLGSETRIHPEVRKYSESSLTKHCKTTEDLAAAYNKAQIIAVTCLGSSHPLLSKRTFDICIVDESTQVLQSSIIRPLYAAKTFILLGDPEQLPAVVKNGNARDYGMNESLFERLYTPESGCALNVNYRMNSILTLLANEVSYNGELTVGNDEVSKATLKLRNKESIHKYHGDYQWIVHVVDDTLEKSVQFLDTGPVWGLPQDVPWLIKQHTSEISTDNSNCLNIYEAAVSVVLVRALIELGLQASEIGVIATYRNQVAQISSLLKVDGVDVNTVDQFQGKDKSVIIYSCSKSRDVAIPKEINKFELLEDKRRITVAITRAKHKLIFIGDIKTVAEYSTFKKLIPFLSDNIIRLPETSNFNWKSLFNCVNNI